MNDESVPVVVIGASEVEKLQAIVLERSIVKHATGPVHIVQTFDMELPKSRHRMGTPFSYVRQWIPELIRVDHHNAIYFDSDMLLFEDIWKLWELRAAFRAVPEWCAMWTPNTPSVCLFHLERMREAWQGKDVFDFIEDVDQGRLTYSKLMSTLMLDVEKQVGPIPKHWNSLDRYQEGHTALIHYTRLRTQPWIDKGVEHNYAGVWYDALEEFTEEDGQIWDSERIHAASYRSLPARVRKHLYARSPATFPLSQDKATPTEA